MDELDIHRWVSSWHVVSSVCLRPPDREPFPQKKKKAQIENLAWTRSSGACFAAWARAIAKAKGRPRQRHVGRGGGGGGRDDDATKKSFLRRAARFGRSADVEWLETPRPHRRRWPPPRRMNRVFARSSPYGTTARAFEPRPAVTDDATAATAVQAEDGGAGSHEFSGRGLHHPGPLPRPPTAVRGIQRWPGFRRRREIDGWVDCGGGAAEVLQSRRRGCKNAARRNHGGSCVGHQVGGELVALERWLWRLAEATAQAEGAWGRS
jgi:hypothetical protein